MLSSQLGRECDWQQERTETRWWAKVGLLSGYVRVSCSSCVVKGPCVLKLSFFHILCLSDFSSWGWWCEITTNSYSQYFWSIFPPAVLSIKGDDQGNSKHMNETQTLLQLGSLVTATLCSHSVSGLMLKPWVGFYTASTQLCQFCAGCNKYWPMELVFLYWKFNILNVQYNTN